MRQTRGERVPQRSVPQKKSEMTAFFEAMSLEEMDREGSINVALVKWLRKKKSKAPLKYLARGEPSLSGFVRTFFAVKASKE